MSPAVTRRLTPAGFLLALLVFLFLPLATASCDVPADAGTAAGTLSTRVTGAGLIASREHLDATGGLALKPAQQSRADRLVQMPGSLRILAVAAAVVLLAAVATTAIRSPRARALTSIAAAIAGLTLLTVLMVLSLTRLTDFARTFLAAGAYLPAVKDHNLDGRAGEVVHTGPGFWVAAALLLLVGELNVLALARARRTAQRMGP
jgi:hypothetical protein